MFNVLTIAREYGSGGSDIGHKVAELMGWECVDKQIIERVSAMGKVDLSWVENADEHASAWWEQLLNGLRYGGIELYSGELSDSAVDHDKLQQFTATVIREASEVGNCVIIGRSSQCVLQHDPHTLRVMVYAPQAEKIKRMRIRHPHEHDLPALLHRMDSERLHYARTYYACDSTNRGLYHLCVNSTLGIDVCAKLIVQVIQSS